MKKLLLAFACFAAQAATAAPILHSTDFIANNKRSHFNGFTGFVTGTTFTLDGITVTQVHADNSTDLNWDYSYWTGADGRNWYPSGGDYGYTRITRTDGSDFSSIGMAIGSGGSASKVMYELWNNGTLVERGNSLLSSHYIGWSGGGFDTILLRDNLGSNAAVVTNGAFQALALDSIETSDVPEPAGLMLAGLGLAALAFTRKRG